MRPADHTYVPQRQAVDLPLQVGHVGDPAGEYRSGSLYWQHDDPYAVHLSIRHPGHALALVVTFGRDLLHDGCAVPMAPEGGWVQVTPDVHLGKVAVTVLRVDRRRIRVAVPFQVQMPLAEVRALLLASYRITPEGDEDPGFDLDADVLAAWANEGRAL